METKVPFTRFIQALKDAGSPIAGSAFLADPQGAWEGLPRDVRKASLRSAGVLCDPADVRIRLGKLPDAPKSLESILVIFLHPEQAETPDEEAAVAESPDEAAPFEGETPGEDEWEAPAEAEPMSEPESTPEAEPLPEAEPMPEAESPHAEAPFPDEMAEEMPFAAEAFADDAPEAEPADADPAPVTALAIPPAPEPDAPEDEDKGGAFRGFLGRLKKNAAAAAAAATPPKPEGEPVLVTEIPPLTDEGMEVAEIYPVQEPYAYVRIVKDVVNHEFRYDVIEPSLTERERNILDFIENTIVDVIEVGLHAQTREQAADLLSKHVDEVIYDYSIVLTPLAREKVLYYILRDFLGFGKLDPIMRDEYIEDVSCDGPGIPIFLYHRKYESIKSTVVFEKDPELDSFVIKMAQRSGKHVSIAEPLLDATLPDGSRLNATLSDEVTDGGSTFTIRKFREDPFTIPDLVKFGTMNEELLAYWWLAVQNGASAIYAGGTASGKTTSLNAILLFIPPQMKIVSIEDTREINIPHENWIAGVTRAGFGPRDNNGRQAGEIDMFSLLKAALRQRPEYILVGEVRGQEATALFQAMATGHTAYGTMHADSTEAVIHRLESDPISIPRSLLEALDIVSIQIQTRIGDRRVRRTKELVEIVGLDPHTREILTNQVFTWSPATDQFEFSGVSYVLERIQIERNMDESEMREEFSRRRRIIRWMVDKNVRSLEEVGRVIATYYRNPTAVLSMVDDDEAADEALAAEPRPPAQQPQQALVVQPDAQQEPWADEEESLDGPQ